MQRKSQLQFTPLLVLLWEELPENPQLVSYSHGFALPQFQMTARPLLLMGKGEFSFLALFTTQRSTPEMWPDLIQKAKDEGLDVIQTYVFWNGHELSPRKIMP